MILRKLGYGFSGFLNSFWVFIVFYIIRKFTTEEVFLELVEFYGIEILSKNKSLF